MDMLASMMGGGGGGAGGLTSMLGNGNIGGLASLLSGGGGGGGGDGSGGVDLTSLLMQASPQAAPQPVRTVQEIDEALAKYRGSNLGESFNTLLAAFLDDLQEAVPENEKIRLALHALTVIRHTAPNEPLRRWAHGVRTHRDCLQKRTPDTESYFLRHAPTIDMLGELEIERYWHTLADEDKDTIWDYLRQLDTVCETLLFKMNSQVVSAVERVCSTVTAQIAPKVQGALAAGASPQEALGVINGKDLGFTLMKMLYGDAELKAALGGDDGEEGGGDAVDDEEALVARRRAAHEYAQRLERERAAAPTSPSVD